MRRIASFFAGSVAHVFALSFVAAAFALLVVVNTTALISPTLVLFEVWNSYVDLHGGTPAVRFGTYGYCLHVNAYYDGRFSASNPPEDQCIPPIVGYDIFDAITPISALSQNQLRDLSSLTQAMVLHPLATACSFFALVSSILPRRYVPSIAPPIICGLATLLALTGAICNLALFAKLKSMLKNAPSTHGRFSYAEGDFDTGAWMLIAAVVCLLVGNTLMVVRWWFQHRLMTVRRGVGDRAKVGQELDQHRGKVNHDSDTSIPPHEEEVGRRAGYLELSQGARADRHELSGQDQGAEVDGRDHQYYELPVTHLGNQS